MKTLSRQMEIEQIVFDNFDQEVLIKGRNFDYPLSYPTQAILSFHGLNLLLNHLRQINSGVNFDALMTEEQLGEQYVQHSIELSTVTNRRIDLALFLDSEPKKLICA